MIVPGASKTFSFTITAPTTPGTYNFQWRMVEEGAEWFGDITPNLTITVVDVAAPTAPTNLTASAITHNAFTLNWTASTDNVGVTGYEVERSAPGTTTVTTTVTGSSLNVTGLVPKTTYAIRLRARDAAGNWSGWVTLPGGVRTLLDPMADDDGDQMTNQWELDNGLDPTVANGLEDPDNDGLTNVAEFGLNTKPREFTSGQSGMGNVIPGGWPNSGVNGAVAVGATQGRLDVDKSGAATYTVPIWVTPGTAGMQPQLALNYSSQGGAGLAGFGWSLSGVSAITRGPQTLATDGKSKGVTLTADDRFYLDGQRLILIGGTYGAQNSEYRTEMETFSEIKALGQRPGGNGPNGFQVRTKAGLTIDFGNEATADDSTFDASNSSAAIAWQVRKITDTKGNYMRFYYTEDTGKGLHRLDRIEYTANDAVSLAAYAVVRFGYDDGFNAEGNADNDRPDWSQGYLAGAVIANKSRLKSIASAYKEAGVEKVARRYTLNYRANTGAQAYNNRSILLSIEESGSADGAGFVSYPQLTFEYEENQWGWESMPGYAPPYYLADNMNENRPTGAGFMDLDNDGRVDFIVRRDGDWNTAQINTGAGWSNTPAYQLPYATAQTSQPDDRGARFVDIDRDGRPDFVWYKLGAGNNLLGSGAVRNTGSGWETAPASWVPPTPIAKDGKNGRSGQFLDVNGDGLVDYVTFLNAAGNDVNLGVYLNTGNVSAPWAYDAGFSTMSASDLPTGKARFIDLNGDGLVDIVARYYGNNVTVSRAYLNTGSGWAASSAYLLPQLIADDVNASVGAEFADVNADGLPDLIWYREILSPARMERGVALNTGTGWFTPGAGTPEYERYAAAAPLARNDTFNAGAAFADLNADGTPDLAFSRQFSGQPAYRSSYYGNGHGWSVGGGSAQHDLTQVLLLDPTVKQTGVDFVDFDADGAMDVIWRRRASNGADAFGAWRNKSRPTQDRLKRVVNGMGVAANITYKSLMDSAVYTKGTGGPAGSLNLIGPMYVVSSVAHDDGLGAQYALTYNYSGLRSDRVRGNLGFSFMAVTDSRTSVRSETTFAQEFPFIGMPLVQKTLAGGVALSETLISYGTKPLNSGKTRFVFAQDTLATTKDPGGNLLSTVDTSIPDPASDIDDYGNTQRIIVDTDGFVRTTVSAYANDPIKWHLGRLSSSTVTTAAAGYVPESRTSTFGYDPASGLLTTETIHPGDATYGLTTTYTYDGFGNKTGITVTGSNLTVNDSGAYQASGTATRKTTYEYDTRGRFPAWKRSYVDAGAGTYHQETYVAYNQLLGALTQLTGVNGLNTTWTHDAFGRTTQETRADGTLSRTTYRWVAGAPVTAKSYPSLALPAAKYHMETESSGAPPALAFYDAFGRAFLGLGINGDGAIVYQTTHRDVQGRAHRVSTPYLASGIAYWQETNSYDILDRPLATVTPDDQNGPQTTTLSYTGLAATASLQGRVSYTARNSQGWMLVSTRNLNALAGATASTVSYGYDVLGNLTSTNADGVTTTLTYDPRGRKAAMADPDMGAWQYRYNVFGELIWQKDAKSQITRLAYDGLGRLTQRFEPEGTTTWTYDAATAGGAWKGKLAAVQVKNPANAVTYAESFTYDGYGRPLSTTRKIDGTDYVITQTYDGLGRLERTIYPTNFQTRNYYNNYGFLREVRRADNGRNDVYWMAESYTATGKVASDWYGNGLVNDRFYSDATGRLTQETVGRSLETGPYSVQHLRYVYDALGNVLQRNESALNLNRAETFTYDGLDRLKSHAVSGGAAVTVAYDAKGNLTSKSDVGNYSYAGTGLHAVSGVSGGPLGTQVYAYDANGNMLSGGGRTITWTSFNQAATITKGSYSSTFSFGAAHERVKQVSHLGTTIYVGALYEKVTAGSAFEHKHYIYAPTGRIAVYTERSNLTKDVRYFHTDGLGSITAVTSEFGVVVKRFAYDAWGKRLDPATGNTITGATATGFSRGFTDHEQLDDLGLVHMNGRVYDPVLGRFLSADPFVDGVTDSQGFNRYSYLGNNPLSGTDPSGYFKLKEVLPAIIAVVVTAVVLVALGPAGMLAAKGFWATLGHMALHGGWINAAIAGGAGGFASGFSGSLLNGGSIGDAFKAGAIGGIIGAASAAIAYGIGQGFDKLGWGDGFFEAGWTGRAIAHGVSQGAITEISGGSFRHGFYAGAFASGASPALGRWFPKTDQIAQRTAVAAVIGGTASALNGGKFANGAVTGAFAHLFNAEATRPKPNADMQISAEGIDMIAEFEGFRGEVYKDQAGYPTIGYGHKLTAGEAKKYAKGISEADARKLLVTDVQNAENAVRRFVNVAIEQSSYDALVSFTYNVGSGALAKSTLLRQLNAGDYISVPTEMARWKNAGGAVSQGLVYRRWREGWLFHGLKDPPTQWAPE